MAFERRIEVQVSNPDLTRTASGMRTETSFPANTILSEASAACTIVDTRLFCRHGSLAAGRQDIITVNAILASADDQQVVTQLFSDNFEDANDADNRAALNVLQIAGFASGDVPADDAVIVSQVGIGGSALWLLSILGLSYLLPLRFAQRRKQSAP